MTALRAGFTKRLSGVRGVLRDSHGVAVWACTHPHPNVGEAYRCAQAELAAQKETAR